jgi:RimJ/RimL family protein N-acetyltransferase
MGYGLATKHWGLRITTMVVKIAFSQVFKDLPNFVRLQAYVDVENEASHSVLEKDGFQKEGLRGKYLYLKGNCYIDHQI